MRHLLFRTQAPTQGAKALSIAVCAAISTLAMSCGDLPSPPIFDLTSVHQVEITVAPEHMDQLADDRENRVPCDITIDGVAIKNAGIRQKGGIGSVSSLDEKPGFSVRFDEFEKNSYFGLRKVLLNNAKQNPGFLDEHLGYELYRRAGLPAPRTAHTVVTLNDRSYGLFVVKEAIDERFLDRTFGNFSGNLFEGPDRPLDFIKNPDGMDLKRETKEMRTRDDLLELVDLIKETPDDQWIEAVSSKIDLDGFIQGFAIDSVVDHWDGYAHKPNNYYMYHNPADDRWVFIPHGMDQLFKNGNRDVMAEPKGELALMILQHDELAQQYQEAVTRMVDEILDVAALQTRMERVETILSEFQTNNPEADDRVNQDINRFTNNYDDLLTWLGTRKAQLSQADN